MFRARSVRCNCFWSADEYPCAGWIHWMDGRLDGLGLGLMFDVLHQQQHAVRLRSQFADARARTNLVCIWQSLQTLGGQFAFHAK